MLDLKARGELLRSRSVLCCIKDGIFVTEIPEAGYIYNTEPFAFALRSLKEIELWSLLKNGILPSENSVGKRIAHVNLTGLTEAIPMGLLQTILTKFTSPSGQLSVQKLFQLSRRGLYPGFFLLRVGK